MTPAISVIMPVHNGADWLPEAVASIRAQDFGDFEFLIVDDGSDDGTAAMLAAFASADNRIRVLHQEPQGIVAALNNAIATARAPYLARLDADDRARPDRLGKQWAFMQAHPEIGLLGTFAETIDAAGNITGRLTPPADGKKLARILRRTNPFVHSSVMMRSELVRRTGGYRAAFRAAEDYDLWLRMAEICDIANLPAYLTQYRQHDANLSRRDAARQSFSVRLAQRSDAVRRGGLDDPASTLTIPPDWWAEEAATSFYAEDVGLYRFLDSDPRRASHVTGAVWHRLFGLNHVERKLAQMRLRSMLHETGSCVSLQKLELLMLIAVLHPPRALSLMWRGNSG
jgi:glycosyltransferase involved in cell wall biosynthesis